MVVELRRILAKGASSGLWLRAFHPRPLGAAPLQCAPWPPAAAVRCVQSSSSSTSASPPPPASPSSDSSLLDKYSAKLTEQARSKGFDSVEALLAATKADAASRRRAIAKEREAAWRKQQEQQQQQDSDATATTGPSSPSPATSPATARKSSSTRSLDDIVDVARLRREDPDRIAAAWNEHHATKDGVVSGVMPAEFFNKLMDAIRKYPTFIFPLPRDDGVEFYLMQAGGKQLYYTPLLEFKTRQEAARPHLVLAHHDELAAEKRIVLMRGDVLVNTLSPELARLLVYQTQLFYATGSERKRALVREFHENPAAFDFQKLIDEMERVD
ncbi:hypothetical protein HK405_010824 [Cladochytrium tenue]|nr:hypothetical protein HK405_010824 [Cladochytrium tenue]